MTHLRVVGQETAPKGTILIFEKNGSEILRAKTWDTYRGVLFGMESGDLKDFKAWVKKQEFPADLDVTDYHELGEVVVDFEEDTYRD